MSPRLMVCPVIKRPFASPRRRTRWHHRLLTLALVLVVSACGDPYAKQIASYDEAIRGRFDAVTAMLAGETLTNAKILKNYLTKARESHPDYASVFDAMAKVASPNNPRLADLRGQHQQTMDDYASRRQPSREILQDLGRIYDAAAPERINAAMVDEINTVAALSGGMLEPLNLPSGATLPSAGSMLVGNPTYGQWSQGTGGQSAWVWFAQYAALQTLLGPMTYGGWYYNRPWSYDYDIYRDRFSSRHWRQRELGRVARHGDIIRREARRLGRRASAYASRTNRTVTGGGSWTVQQDSFAQARGEVAQTGRRISSYQTTGAARGAGARRGSIYGGRRTSGYAPSSRSRGSSRSYRGK